MSHKRKAPLRRRTKHDQITQPQQAPRTPAPDMDVIERELRRQGFTPTDTRDE